VTMASKSIFSMFISWENLRPRFKAELFVSVLLVGINSCFTLTVKASKWRRIQGWSFDARGRLLAISYMRPLLMGNTWNWDSWRKHSNSRTMGRSACQPLDIPEARFWEDVLVTLGKVEAHRRQDVIVVLEPGLVHR
jgi:hypothetical protein